MKNKIFKLIICVTALFTSAVYAQDTIKPVTFKKKLNRTEVLDSIKSTFVHDKLAQCIDSLWMKELTSLDLYEELTLDIKNIDVDKKVDYELSTELFKERLKRLDEKSPFNIEYNIGLENIVKSFLKNRKRTFEKLMGVSQFYFPMFEEALATQNIPLEIKYLAVVESALNPRATSRVGATGLWQFMYHTGKQYGLNIDSYVDERSDPLKSSNAATQYMTNMYKIFGDWDLVLAAYNSGPGNVSKAIRRSGGKQNYWNIRKNLPRETQGYLPAFLATMYIFEYHKEHGIKPDKAIANHFATDTILIKNKMTFKQISDLLDVPVAELQFLNPSYKREVVPFVTGEKHFLRLPVDKIAVFTSNEEKIYAYLNYEENNREKPYQQTRIAVRDSVDNGNETSPRVVTRIKYHKVRKGDSLSEIADRYGITMSELKKWNRLRNNKAPLGRNLKIQVKQTIFPKEQYANAENQIATKEHKRDTTSVKETKHAVATYDKVYKTEKVVSFKDVTKYHKVKRGDNLGEIADKYGVTIAEVKKWNKLRNNNVRLGESLKIVKNERVVTTVRKEVKVERNIVEPKVDTAIAAKEADIEKNPQDYYEVQKGDNLFTIAKKFNVGLDDLKKWNNLGDYTVRLGSKIALNENNAIDSEEEDQEVQTDIKVVEYTVQAGDNLGNIAKKNNVSISDLRDWNEIDGNTIKQGQKLIVGKKLIALDEPKTKAKAKKERVEVAERKNTKTYLVKKGDSLFSIAKKYPGVTITDIKKWNGIKSESIKPGMKLKING